MLLISCADSYLFVALLKIHCDLSVVCSVLTPPSSIMVLSKLSGVEPSRNMQLKCGVCLLYW